jgi:thiol-disulfide isomerase/thioredoxin
MRSPASLLLSSILMVSLLSGCHSGEDSPLSGQLQGAEGATITVASLGPSGYTPFDTATADPGGRFAFASGAFANLALDVYEVKVGTRVFYIIADSLSSIEVSGELPESKGLATKVQMTGDVWSANFADFIQETAIINDSLQVWKLRTKDKSISEDERNAARTEFSAGRELLIETARRTASAHKSDPVGLMAMEYLNLSTDRALAKEIIDSTRTLMGHSAAHRNLSRRVSKQRTPANQQQRRNGKITVGMAMPDIALNDPNGTERALSDLKGKVVLVDFWASWCGPCRRENPNVVRAYKEYNDRGFEVFSISLDKTSGKWERAIEQDGLIWPHHISDLKGWNSIVTDIYGISSIPHAILIDQLGTVVATHLRGSQLEAELDKLL